MHLHALLQLVLSLPLTANAEPVPLFARQKQPPHDLAVTPRSDLIVPRARPDAPSGGYAPSVVECPKDRPRIRLANALSQAESEWLAKRRKNTVDPMIQFLKRAEIPDFDAEAYIKSVSSGDDLSNLPNIAIAVSGGGYRALMNGAGFISAADSRTPGSTDKGGIGGLLQSTTYLSGLSGGGWLVSSIYANNFSTISTLQRGRKDSSIWRFDDSIFNGPDLPGVFDTARYWADVAEQVRSKRKAGFETSITDYWGRALSYQLIDAPDGGPAYTFSSISEDDHFSAGQAPFPILVADNRPPGMKAVTLSATVFEFNPFEMGSWDPTTYGFAPTRYLASNFSGGVVPSSGRCVRGFDSISYVFGTSSSLFNAFLLQNITSVEGVPDWLIEQATNLLEDIDEKENDVAKYEPNPFLGWLNASNPVAHVTDLDLVDGGEDLQNIPLQPLIQPLRAVDVIFAVDSSADTTFSWPNGTALRATYDRSLTPIANGTLFPPVPDDVTFLARGLNNRPTFFGCSSSNFTVPAGGRVPPLVVYLPNAPYTTYSNVTTFTPSYPLSQRNDIILNGYNAATQGNGTLDENWVSCVACAVLSRSLDRTGTAVPARCTECFEKYCWDGKTAAQAGDVSIQGVVSGAGGEEYQPTLKIQDVEGEESGAASMIVGRSGMIWVCVVVAFVGLML